MPKGLDLQCAAGTARVWLQGKGGALTPGRAMVLLPRNDGEKLDAAAAYVAPLRTALIEENRGHVNVVVGVEDYRALKRGIVNLKPGVQ